MPNRYTAVSGTRQGVAVNDLASSPVSTATRGHYVDVVDTDPVPVNGETLDSYAARMLRGLSTVSDTREYTREYIPGVTVYDIVEAAAEGMSGQLRVMSQTLETGHGITVSERACREVDLWQ